MSDEEPAAGSYSRPVSNDILSVVQESKNGVKVLSIHSRNMLVFRIGNDCG